MKIITLNAWAGRAGEDKILQFFEKYKDTDIICLQEIYHKAVKVVSFDKGDMLNIFSNIQKVLTEHKGYFRPSQSNFGLALFIKKDIQVSDEGSISIYEVENYAGGSHSPRNLQYIHFLKDDKEYTIANVHALWNGMGKTDTEERLQQSIVIKNYMDSAKGLKVLCGDFNLLPDTKSISILEEGMRNLIKEYKITSTRTDYYKKPEKYADYVFVSPEVKVKDFQVLPNDVSDHAPLLLEVLN